MKTLRWAGWIGCWTLLLSFAAPLATTADASAARRPVGLDSLRSVTALRKCRALLFPNDECYPDEGGMNGPLAQNLAGYVRGGATPGRAAGQISCQVTLTDAADWELAEATGVVSAVPDDLSGLSWTKVRLPSTVQYALFRAGKTPNPWFADNYKQLQPLHRKD